MSDMICRKTMMRCQTLGMCAPHGGCSTGVLVQTDVRYSNSTRIASTEIADLKARLLEAERGAEELVRLRAENRELVERIQQIVTHPHESKEALAQRVRQILEQNS